MDNKLEELSIDQKLLEQRFPVSRSVFFSVVGDGDSDAFLHSNIIDDCFMRSSWWWQR